MIASNGWSGAVGDADANRKSDMAAGDWKLHRRQGFPQAFGHSLRHLNGTFRQEGQKLLASHAAQYIVPTKRRLTATNDMLQHLVSNRMTVSVVDAFEVINVEHQDG